MSKKMIKLKSSDGESFEIDEAIALQSKTLSNMIEDGCANCEIPLANVTGSILAKVIEYCKKHVDTDTSSEETTKNDLNLWDAEYMKNMDQSTLFHVILAANYLHVKDLLDLSCQTVADMITGKTPEEIRTTFNIENDFTPEEEEQNRMENQWAFE